MDETREAVRDEFEREYQALAERAADMVAPVFVVNGWRYATTNGRSWVPSWGELRDTALRLIRMVGDGESECVACGRFVVRQDGERTLSVALELGDCTSRHVRPYEDDEFFGYPAHGV